MIVKLRQPKREIEMAGARTVNQLLDSLGMNRESFLVIRNGTLAPGDARLDDHPAIGRRREQVCQHGGARARGPNDQKVHQTRIEQTAGRSTCAMCVEKTR